MARHVRLIVGCGYVGLRAAQQWLSLGDRVLTVTRSADKAASLSQQGIEAKVWDWHHPLSATSSPAIHLAHDAWVPRDLVFDSVLIAVSHAPVPGVAPEHAHVRGLEHLSGWLNPADAPTRWVYLSTTGVFAGTTSGEWVDETSAVGPTRPGSIAALEGERWIESRVPQSRRVVLRPAGIYGPGRVPNVEPIRTSTPMSVDPNSFLNLVHVDDLVGIIVAATQAPTASPLYCVSDGNSPMRQDYYEWIAQLGGWPSPKFASQSTPTESSSTAAPHLPRVRARSDSNKRIDCHRLRTEIDYCFQYPSYREGLTALAPELRP